MSLSVTTPYLCNFKSCKIAWNSHEINRNQIIVLTCYHQYNSIWRFQLEDADGLVFEPCLQINSVVFHPFYWWVGEICSWFIWHALISYSNRFFSKWQHINNTLWFREHLIYAFYCSLFVFHLWFALFLLRSCQNIFMPSNCLYLYLLHTLS